VDQRTQGYRHGKESNSFRTELESSACAGVGIRIQGLSRFKPLTRLMGMNRNKSTTWIWMAGIVLAHLVISIVHGSAHTNAHVALSPAGNLFVFVVILAGPLIGLGLLWPSMRIGAWLIMLAMAGALIFGVVNHFVFSSPDHVAHIDPQWRSVFTTTAILLAATEALGSVLAFQTLRERRLL